MTWVAWVHRILAFVMLVPCLEILSLVERVAWVNK